MALRIIFMGSPDFAVPTLSALIAHAHDVVAVYTQPPRRAGRRGLKVRKTPVHRQAQALGLPVLTPADFTSNAVREAFAAHDGDVAVVVAYGLLLPPAVLAAPRHGCLNLHASLLPRWRGAAPIARAIMAGDKETGVTVMRMEAGLDTGPVALVERCAIGADDTAGTVHDRLMGLGADVMVRALAALERGSLDFSPQASAGVCVARKIAKQETRIDWSKPAGDVHDHIRALSPHPGAWFEVPGDDPAARIKVLRAVPVDAHGAPGEVLDDAPTIACGTGAVRLITLQRAGRKPLEAKAFQRGYTIARGTRLGRCAT